MNKILLVGCGSLGKIILEGLISPKNKITVLEKKPEERKKINFSNVNVIEDYDSDITENFDYVLICVKPKDCINFLKKIKKKKINKIFISFVAGLSISKIISILDYKKLKVVRIMPNILIKNNKSSTGIFTKNIDASIKQQILDIFYFFGYFYWLEKESDFHFFTAMYGGGPAYLLYFFECFNRISFKNKIKKKDSVYLLTMLLEGSIQILKKNPEDFSTFIKNVTSKGGTTEQAMKILKKDNILFKTFEKAMKSAADRSRTISNEIN